MGICQIYKKFS